MLRLPFLFSVVVLMAASACDDPMDPGGGPAADAAPGGDAAGGCDPRTVLPTGWQPVAKVSAGAVSSTSAAGVHTTSVDATAGGFGNSAGEPFVYLSFTGGTAAKVTLDDPSSFDSDEWDLAFKRYVIRANGGDSGPGDVAVAAVPASNLDAVTEMPSAASFGLDDFATDDCTLVSDQLGAPLTAIGVWYSASNGHLDPLPTVYVVKLRDGSHIKLKIVTYYGDPADPSRSAYFKLDWAPL